MLPLSSLTLPGFKSQTVQYQCLLHKKLVLRLQDPSLALRIYRSFQRHIASLLQKEEEEIFQKALIISAILPGSKKTFIKTIQELGFDAKLWAKKNKNALISFLSDSIPPIFPAPKKEIFKICILTTSASGGNYTVARAVEKFLNSKQNLYAEILDVETFAIHDPLKQAIGITYDGI